MKTGVPFAALPVIGTPDCSRKVHDAPPSDFVRGDRDPERSVSAAAGDGSIRYRRCDPVHGFPRGGAVRFRLEGETARRDGNLVGELLFCPRRPGADVSGGDRHHRLHGGSGSDILVRPMPAAGGAGSLQCRGRLRSDHGGRPRFPEWPSAAAGAGSADAAGHYGVRILSSQHRPGGADHRADGAQAGGDGVERVLLLVARLLSAGRGGGDSFQLRGEKGRDGKPRC